VFLPAVFISMSTVAEIQSMKKLAQEVAGIKSPISEKSKSQEMKGGVKKNPSELAELRRSRLEAKNKTKQRATDNRHANARIDNKPKKDEKKILPEVEEVEETPPKELSTEVVDKIILHNIDVEVYVPNIIKGILMIILSFFLLNLCVYIHTEGILKVSLEFLQLVVTPLMTKLSSNLFTVTILVTCCGIGYVLHGRYIGNGFYLKIDGLKLHPLSYSKVNLNYSHFYNVSVNLELYTKLYETYEGKGLTGSVLDKYRNTLRGYLQKLIHKITEEEIADVALAYYSSVYIINARCERTVASCKGS